MPFSGVDNIITGPSPEVFGDKSGENTKAIVKRVIDGDTIELDNGKKLRYIGIDTPERIPSSCFAAEAAGKNEELVLGKEVRLEKDVSETDRYGRLLRYVYVRNSVSGEEVFVNENLVREGYATAVTYPPDVKYTDLFRQADKEARENKRGLWDKCG